MLFMALFVYKIIVIRELIYKPVTKIIKDVNYYCMCKIKINQRKIH